METGSTENQLHPVAVSDEAVDAAAAVGLDDFEGLKERAPFFVNAVRAKTRAILEAAAPHMVSEDAAKLQPYKDELLKIAAQVGEPDDPFAAWETIDLLQKRQTMTPPERAALAGDDIETLVGVWRAAYASNGGNLNASMRRVLEEFAALKGDRADVA